MLTVWDFKENDKRKYGFLEQAYSWKNLEYTEDNNVAEGMQNIVKMFKQK